MKVVLTGDFSPCRNFERIVLEKKEQVFGELLPIILSADLSFTNLECPLTINNKSINKSGPALKANPECVNALMPFSVIGLANNHILDFGRKGLEDTLDACHSNGLPTVGAGLNLAQAQTPFIHEINGFKVAIIAIAEHEFNQSENGGAGSAPIDPIDNYRQIQEAKAKADVVIITIHGGNEYFPYPRPGLRKLCKYFIDVGAEAVICHHPHVPGAYEYYQGKPIVYSLGNLIFDTINPPKDWDLGYLAQLKFSFDSKKFESMELIPYKQSIEFGEIRLLRDEEKTKLLNKLEIYKENINSEQSWLREWENFVARQANSYILRQFFPINFRGLGFLSRITPIVKFFFRKNQMDKLNILRCQSHRELLISVLEGKVHPRND